MISFFDDEQHGYLSNFYPARVHLEGTPTATVEHAFQAAKTLDPFTRRRILHAKTPGQAKRLGNLVPLRDDWETIKKDVMFTLLREKFNAEPCRTMLLATGLEFLVEGNFWHDVTWGVCVCDVHRGEGRNWLGELLMKVRDELGADNHLAD